MEIIKEVFVLISLFILIYVGSFFVTYGKYKATELWNKRHKEKRVCDTCFKFFEKNK